MEIGNKFGALVQPGGKVMKYMVFCTHMRCVAGLARKPLKGEEGVLWCQPSRVTLFDSREAARRAVRRTRRYRSKTFGADDVFAQTTSWRIYACE